MSVPEHYTVSRDALRQAEHLGLTGDVHHQLRRMARFSAPVTHPQGNRRYEGFVLRVDDGLIVSVSHLTNHGGLS